MSFTIGDVQAGTQARGYGSSTAGEQLVIAQTALRRIYNLRRWPFMEAATTADLAAGTNSVPMPASADRVDAVFVTYGSDTWALEFLPQDQLTDLAQTDTAPDEPMYWSIGRGEASVVVWPKADKAYTLQLQTILKPAVPTDTTTPVPYLPDVFLDQVIYAVCADMSSRQRDVWMHSYWQQMAEESLAEIVRRYAVTQRQSPREVVRWDGWDQVER